MTPSAAEPAGDAWRFQQQREEQARVEVGQTVIRAGTAWTMALLFLLVIALVPVGQRIYETRATGTDGHPPIWSRACNLAGSLASAGEHLLTVTDPLFTRLVSSNRGVLADLNACQDTLEDESVLGHLLRPPAQYVLTAWLGAGNEQTYAGQHPWLYYRPGVEYLTGPGFLEPAQLRRRARAGDQWNPAPQPDPRTALTEFKLALDQRGIPLIVVPTPIKPMIDPEHLTAHDPGVSRPLQNPSYHQLVDDLRREGILVADVAETLVAAKRRSGEPQFLATDTHWRPQAVELAAEELVKFIGQHVSLPAVSSPGYRSRSVDQENVGDLVTMLDLPAGQTLYGRERVRVRQITTADNGPWQPDPSADVLVLGDSFSNIYSLEAMGWGASAGLVEQLSYLMRRPVDRIARNDGGAFATREELAADLVRGQDRLAGKRLVVLQFAMRELSMGDWKLVELPEAGTRPPDFIVPPAGQTIVVRGVIQAIGSVPRPGSVPYKDHIVAVHLVDVHTDDGAVENGQALVYLWSMQDNVWTDAAYYRPGQRLTIRLRAWADVASSYDGINRSELADERVMLADPTWGESMEVHP